MYGEVAVIILNYNNFKDTIQCVNSILKHCESNYVIYIIDNNSSNDSYYILKQYYHGMKNIIIERNSENNGYGAGNNFGIKYALNNNHKYFWILNNDTYIESDVINKCLDTSVRFNDALVLPIILYPDRETIFYGGGIIDFKKVKLNMPLYKCNINEFTEEYLTKDSINYFSGCSIFISKKNLLKTDLIPEEYFMYYEDVDFSVELFEKIENIILDKSIKVFHNVSSASGGEKNPFSYYWNNRNRVKFFRKYSQKYNIYQKIYFYIYYIFTRFLSIIKYSLIDYKLSISIYFGMIDGLFNKKNRRY